MSWIMNPDGRDIPRNAQDDQEEKVEDYSGRKVSNRAANQPFLSYTKYRMQQKAEHEAWLQRKKERDEKLAKGEEVGPEEPDPTAEVEVGLLGLMKFIVYCLIFIALAGKFFTGSFLWDYESHIPALKSLIPTNQRLFSEDGLLAFDGTDPKKPIYLAIDGDVYDVSESPRTYGPGGSYHFMAGTDAARAFATGCFATHRTYDLRGLNERELKSVEHWKNFFANHKKYTKVGKVAHRPIDPASPIPEPCQTQKPKPDETKKGVPAKSQQDKAQASASTQQKHEEL